MARLDVELVPQLADNYAYILHDRESGASAVIDPAEARPVLDRLRERGLSPGWIIATHHHADHVAGIPELKAATGARVAGPEADRRRVPEMDHGLSEGEALEIGGALGRVIATPGHTSGHVSLYFEDAAALFSADTLFVLGCGRLLEGTPAQMHDSLQKLAALPDVTRVFCGHEYTAANARFALTIDPDNVKLRELAEDVGRARAAGKRTVPSLLGDEKAANPFLRPNDPAIRRRLGLETADDVEVFAEIRRRKDRA